MPSSYCREGMTNCTHLAEELVIALSVILATVILLIVVEKMLPVSKAEVISILRTLLVLFFYGALTSRFIYGIYKDIEIEIKALRA